jgi:hypothetical protein
MIDVQLRLLPDALQIALDRAGKQIEAYIKYPFIKCLNPYDIDSFFFKSNKFGYAMIFKSKRIGLGNRCFKHLLMLLDQENNSQNIFNLDVTHMMPKLEFAEISFKYKFSYDGYIDEIKNNPAKLTILKAKEPKDLGLNFEHMDIDI